MGTLVNKIEVVMQDEKHTGQFPKLAKALKEMGVSRYDYSVLTGRYTFSTEEGTLEARLNGAAFPIAEIADQEDLRRVIAESQAGKLTFHEFIEQAGQAGIKYWMTELDKMQISYFDSQESLILVEQIPQV